MAERSRGRSTRSRGLADCPASSTCWAARQRFCCRAGSSAKGERIQAGVDNVPDTPLKTFELRIDGGKPGYLVLSRNICRTKTTANASFTSQDGETYAQRIPVKADCGGTPHS